MWYAMGCRSRNGVTGSGWDEFAEFAYGIPKSLQIIELLDGRRGLSRRFAKRAGWVAARR
jgi:hypothetical protein